ncbi:LysM domain-containing protein [uncultured Lactobacillus sp.]|uniref:LysM peptidoglycan-binding domain-containing protein n=1 Tax=uncultured Lactobacillus sp. TaxID=153152 RepID=UPI0026137CA7|nr:LysM domain-containing protein [uncultured Lactobacillus sp.]
MADSNEIKPVSTNLTNEETKQAINAFKPKSVEVAPKVEKPIPVAKEVKPVVEVKDPKGMFDYTGCEQYTVQDGESLFDVAQKYKVALQQLRYFNHVPKDTMRVKPKQTLYIPKEPVLVPVGE